VIPVEDNVAWHEVSLSSALAAIFRGKLCDTLLQNRSVIAFDKDKVIYEIGDKNHTFFFIRRGFVKLGTITEDGHEIIYDIRKDGDVVGELCVCEYPRRDRAVAIEQTEVIPVAYAEILGTLQKNPDLLRGLVEVFCGSLSDACDQIEMLAVDDTVRRLVKVLLKLAAKLGRPSGKGVELATYMTQEEISQVVIARRERVSTALNFLRRRGMVQYARDGHLVLNVKMLENYLA